MKLLAMLFCLMFMSLYGATTISFDDSDFEKEAIFFVNISTNIYSLTNVFDLYLTEVTHACWNYLHACDHDKKECQSKDRGSLGIKISPKTAKAILHELFTKMVNKSLPSSASYDMYIERALALANLAIQVSCKSHRPRSASAPTMSL